MRSTSVSPATERPLATARSQRTVASGHRTRHGLSAYLVDRLFARVEHGHLRVVSDGETREYGDRGSDLEATLTVHDASFFRDVVLHGEVGIGRSYVQKKWSSPCLEDLALLVHLNLDMSLPLVKFGTGLLYGSRIWDRIARQGRRSRGRSTLENARRGMSISYEVGNEFFRLMLGPSMQYSCAIWASPDDSLEEAQRHKIDLLIEKLALAANHSVLDIGCGWGTLVREVWSRFGCSVHGISLAQKQIDYCRKTFPEGRFDCVDYRELPERKAYDRIVSVGMIEHVGHDYIQTFMDSVARLLKPGGRAVLHTMIGGDTIYSLPGVHYNTFARSTVVPISYVPQSGELLKAINNTRNLHPVHCERFGQHYGKTMREWRRNILDNQETLARLSSEELVRTYDYLYAMNSGNFTSSNLDLLQIVVDKGPVNNHVRLSDPRA